MANSTEALCPKQGGAHRGKMETEQFRTTELQYWRNVEGTSSLKNAKPLYVENSSENEEGSYSTGRMEWKMEWMKEGMDGTNGMDNGRKEWNGSIPESQTNPRIQLITYRQRTSIEE